MNRLCGIASPVPLETWSEGAKMDESSHEPGSGPQSGPESGTALASGPALRMWLVSVLVLALAAGSAWSMRAGPDRPTIRIVLPQAQDPGNGPSG